MVSIAKNQEDLIENIDIIDVRTHALVVVRIVSIVLPHIRTSIKLTTVMVDTNVLAAVDINLINIIIGIIVLDIIKLSIIITDPTGIKRIEVVGINIKLINMTLINGVLIKVVIINMMQEDPAIPTLRKRDLL